jgi:hypothetical protein
VVFFLEPGTHLLADAQRQLALLLVMEMMMLLKEALICTLAYGLNTQRLLGFVFSFVPFGYRENETKINYEYEP